MPIEVRAIGVNFLDLLMTKGQHQYRPDPPVVPGCEVAGQIVQAPHGSPWAPGDRVAAFIWHGGFAEQAVAPLSSLVRISDEVDWASAAAMVVNYHTVHFALARRGAVRPGETVLVMGAGGGIGSAAVQVALGLGARVIAGVANEGQVATARAAGATEVIVLDKGFFVPVREMTGGRGIDAVLDPLGDWLLDESLRALAPEGRVLVIGFAAVTSRAGESRRSADTRPGSPAVFRRTPAWPLPGRRQPYPPCGRRRGLRVLVAGDLRPHPRVIVHPSPVAPRAAQGARKPSTGDTHRRAD